MKDPQDPQWLRWARALQALAQNGLTYAENGFDRERYEQIRVIAAEMMEAGSGLPAEQVRALFQRETGYQTPKVDSRGVIFRDQALLLVRERSDGRWTLPGGWVDPNESPREAVEREVWEESGYRVQAEKLLAVYDRARHPHEPPHPYSVYKLFIRCRLLGGTPVDNLETEQATFFREEELPELSIERVTSGQLARMFEHHRNPQWPADFD
ncbi:MAG: NUDIX hydrolase [bacterium]|jgi:ADP-ribose pyrophosphatase YjhB (NUDIX family)